MVIALGLVAGALAITSYELGIIVVPESAPRPYGLASGAVQVFVVAFAVLRSLRVLSADDGVDHRHAGRAERVRSTIGRFETDDVSSHVVLP